MEISEELQLAAKEKFLYIDKFNYDNSKNMKTLIQNIIWIFEYLCDYGTNQSANFSKDEEIKKISDIIKRQFKYFKHVFSSCENTNIVDCYGSLRIRSGLRFLKDIFVRTMKN
ncbi:hypothetical protein DMUE_5101 [Dictyocoela muelleri]|nr:hypothetical protein DMUE_5101 [Dictyocoela muelleri]